MSDTQPFGTRQSTQPGKKSAIGLAGSALASGGNKLLEAVRGDQNMRKHWEFLSSLHAHNEGISHHYQMERMQADHTMQMERMGAAHGHTMEQIGKQGSVDRLNVTHTGKVGRQNLEHAAGVAESMPKHNVSMSTGSSGEVSFSSQKVQKPKKQAEESGSPAEESGSSEETPSPAKPPTTRTNARGMSGAKNKASRTPGVTTPKKAQKSKPDEGYSI
jgi:hypothetical protein